MLLDTSVVVWMSSDVQRIGTRARAAVESEALIFVSAITYAELRVKSMLGKLLVPEDLEQRLEDRGVRHLSFTVEHADALQRFPELVGHDRFDRLLLAQAAAEGIRFLTADRRLLALGLDWVVDARA